MKEMHSQESGRRRRKSRRKEAAGCAERRKVEGELLTLAPVCPLPRSKPRLCGPGGTASLRLRRSSKTETCPAEGRAASVAGGRRAAGARP